MQSAHAIKNSCNVYFFNLAKRLGVDKIAEMATKMGHGHELDIGVEGEKPGLVPTKDWKEKRYKEVWQMGDTLNVGIGQGYVLATPLQLAIMAARVASGKAVKPHLPLGKPTDEFERLGIPEELYQEEYAEVMSFLESKKFFRYEISNFAQL